MCLCVFTCQSMWTYLKPAALGTLGFISSSCVISMPTFRTVHQVTQYINQPLPLKSPLSQNSSGLLYLTDAQERLSHHSDTSQSATATDSGINKDGRPRSCLAPVFVWVGPEKQAKFSWLVFIKNPAVSSPYLRGFSCIWRSQQLTVNLSIRNARLWLCLFWETVVPFPSSPTLYCHPALIPGTNLSPCSEGQIW